jgi:hypothetical protein
MRSQDAQDPRVHPAAPRRSNDFEITWDAIYALREAALEDRDFHTVAICKIGGC